MRTAHRVLYLSVLIIAVGCNLFPTPILPPAGLNIVPGGPANTNPYFGKLRTTQGTPIGDFMLASCGCGDWRVLIEPSNGLARASFPVHFYTQGDYTADKMVTVYGEDEESGEALSAALNQLEGLTTGVYQPVGEMQSRFDATRGDSHNQPVEACGKCHIGEDTVYPLPSWHPQKYKTNPNVCFECHTVNGG